MSAARTPEPLRDARSEAERAVVQGSTILAGVGLAMDGDLSAPTVDNARRLAAMMDAGISQAVKARRLSLEAAGAG